VHLAGDGKCSVYEDRPITCREHPYERCEFGSSIAKSVDLFFGDYQSLERFCRKRFKRWDRRFR
jgi:Fe-S-cluster containining protein